MNRTDATIAALIICGLIWLWALGGIARCSPCPAWSECWQADAACERTKARAWKPCRKIVRRCFEKAERCGG